MGAIADLNNTEKLYDSGLDAVVIRRCTGCIVGGRTLDMSNFPDEFVRSGHIVIYDPDTKNFKPMPVNEGKYSNLPSGHKYSGVVVCTKPSERPFVAIMNDGEVNDEAMPYPLTEEMRSAIKEAIPTLIFTHD